MELPKSYDASKVEHKIYEKWEKSGYFNPDNLPDSKKREPFTIIMPPPNANAPMHIGHALFVTIEDILIRFQRMNGKRALWLPGTDHAGFETQVVFEKKLEKEGRSRFKMEREEFYKEAYEFVQANKHITEEGLKRLGASCDWDRNIFTLDERIIKIVYETFQKMYEDGLIYRGNRISNWCTKHQTALSNLETKYEEQEDPLYYIKYGPLELATVRPETKFGDTGVAVNPKDKRYEKYVGTEIEIKTLLGPKKIKVIADNAVDPEFGTGVVKITPAHDPNDFEIWQRHKQEISGPKAVIDKFGKMNELTGPYKGLKILEARKKIVEDMTKKGLLDPNKTDHKYKHNVQLCYKCKRTIEPLIIPQWFVAMNKKPKDGRPSLKDMAVKAVKDKEVKFMPERFENNFMRWMESLRDWPISRQIWWGIPIPVWYKTETGTDMEMVHFKEKILCKKIGLTDEKDFDNFSQKLIQKNNWKFDYMPWGSNRDGIIQVHIGFINLLKEKRVLDDEWVKRHRISRPQIPAKMHIGEKPPEDIGWYQDPDTFDTWFSSGQWPYATLQALGKKDFETYFPTQVMETGWDILFFWVARMIMMSYYRTGKKPFSTVLMHGLVRDKDRKKMSKSKGNVVDPLGVIDTYGTDALRMALIFSTSAGNDIPLAEDKIKGMKHFANKLWNIARFILANVDKTDWKYEIITESDKNINDKLEALKISATNNLENFRLHEAAQEIYQFVWHSFADIYLEESKKQMANEKLTKNTKKLLLHIFINTIKLLHPFMPFITEELWSKLYSAKLLGKDPMLMVSKWPKNN